MKLKTELLTPERILALKPGRSKIPGKMKDRVVVWDSKQPGLGVRVTAGLKRSFLIRETGEDSFQAIAEIVGTTVEQMMVELQRARDQVHDRQSLTRPLAAADVPLTLGALIDDWWAANRDHWQGQTEGTFTSARKHLPEEWKAMPFASITVAMAARAHRRIQGKGAADMFKAVMRAVYKHAISRGWATFNPFVAVRAHGGNHRAVTLEPEETQALDTAIAALDEPDRSYFRLARLLGPRKLELLELKWSSFSPVRGTLTFPKRKNMKHHPLHVVPLGIEALGIVMGLQSRGRSKYLFPNYNSVGPLTRRDAVWAKVIKSAGLEHLEGVGNLHQHDLRSLLISRMLQTGVPVIAVAGYVGDKPATILKHYASQVPLEDKMIAARTLEAALASDAAVPVALTETKIVAASVAIGRPQAAIAAPVKAIEALDC